MRERAVASSQPTATARQRIENRTLAREVGDAHPHGTYRQGMGETARRHCTITTSDNRKKWTAEHNNLTMVRHNNLMSVREVSVEFAVEELAAHHSSRLVAAGTAPGADVIVHPLVTLTLAVLPHECLLSLLGAMPLAGVLVPLQGTDTVSLACHDANLKGEW